MQLLCIRLVANPVHFPPFLQDVGQHGQPQGVVRSGCGCKDLGGLLDLMVPRGTFEVAQAK
eukprot:7449315-Alexandrium_andersonii.AAC.1